MRFAALYTNKCKQYSILGDDSISFYNKKLIVDRLMLGYATF